MIGGPGWLMFAVHVVENESPATVSSCSSSVHGTSTVLPSWARPPITRSHTLALPSSPPSPPSLVASRTYPTPDLPTWNTRPLSSTTGLVVPTSTSPALRWDQ